GQAARVDGTPLNITSLPSRKSDWQAVSRNEVWARIPIPESASDRIGNPVPPAGALAEPDFHAPGNSLAVLTAQEPLIAGGAGMTDAEFGARDARRRRHGPHMHDQSV